MSTLPASPNAVPPVVCVWGDVDPADPVAGVDAAVIRHQLERRVGPVTLQLCSTSTEIDTIGSTWSRPAAGTPVDVELTDSALFGGPVPLAALFHEQADPLAIDIRRRLRARLDGAAEGVPRTPLDIYVAVLDDADGTGDHPGLRALRAGGSMPTGDLHAEFDRLADQIRHAVPGVATVQSQQSTVDDLRRALADERSETARLSAAVQRLDNTIGVLTQRLAAAEFGDHLGDVVADLAVDR